MAHHGEQSGSLGSQQGPHSLILYGSLWTGHIIFPQIYKDRSYSFSSVCPLLARVSNGLPGSHEIIAIGPLFTHEDLRLEIDLPL